MSGGCARCRLGRMSEVGGAWRCCRAPLSRRVTAVPAWEAFPEVNRVVVSRLLGLLVERMIRETSGGNGGERGEPRSEAALGAG